MLSYGKLEFLGSTGAEGLVWGAMATGAGGAATGSGFAGAGSGAVAGGDVAAGLEMDSERSDGGRL